MSRISNSYMNDLEVQKGAAEMEIVVHIAADYDLIEKN